MDFQLPTREQNSNKGTFGKVLNVSGSENYRGAAYLSTYSALKIGAGLAALASCKTVINTVAIQLPEAVFLNRKQGIKQFNKFDVLLIGCGLGQSLDAINDFKRFMKSAKEANVPTVVDADGLNIMAKFKKNYEDFLTQNLVITPHPMEAARLLEKDVNYVLNDLENAAKELTQKYNCVTVLKSHSTVVCDKDFNLYINKHGNSALAKAGTGDVLAGIISGLLAQKLTTFDAAKLGVYLHSVSGEIASKDLTEYSVEATDVIKYLPQAIKTLLP